MKVTRIELDEIPVMCVSEHEGEGGPGSVAGKAFERLEGGLESLRGRRFYGLFYVASGEYRACTALRDEDDPEALGFIRGTIPGGSYLRTRLRGEPDEIYPLIPATVSDLVARATDSTRPSIEFYRRRDALDLLVPIGD